MLRIPCPECGERDYTEFRYGGDAGKVRPMPGSGNRKEWHDYVYLFENPKGPHRELWQHVLGCRQWLVLERNTATNAVIGSQRAADYASRHPSSDALPDPATHAATGG